MKIGIDCRLWNETGVGRYVRNLVVNLAEIDVKNEYILFVLPVDEGSIRSNINNPRFKIVLADVSWHGFEEQIRMPKILNSQVLDLVHFPYFSIPLFYNKPFVVTVHDLIINSYNTGRASTLPYPVYLAKRVGYHAVLSSAILRSKKIIVPSESVKNDLLATYKNLNSNKVNVTYEGGFEKKITDKRLKIKDIEGRYFLRVGNFYPHKNVEGLLSSFAEYIKDPEQRGLKLVLVGKRDYFYKKIEKEIERLNMAENLIFMQNIDDEELVGLYKNATAAIIPSFAEGFSLTAVEAMSCGCPVIASDIPVHREVCGEAAIYCNPSNTNDIKQKINFVCSLVDSSRKDLIEQGKNQAKKFSWEKMAEKTLQIYETCV